MSPQQVFSDRYEMVNHIARGGMAQVYLAKDLLLDRPVALKVLFPELSVDRSFVERFRREAKAAANLSHPNIVSVYDWGQGERTYFIVLEYVDGNTLSQLLRRGPIDSRRAAAIGADVAAALDFAHKSGVIHRDVKPGNVLINKAGQVKVADFGIARAVGTAEDLTQTGSVMGTATYFSPEQAQGYTVDPRSDVYSLGVVLYEMVTGRAPFTGDSPVSIAYKHVKEEPPAPSTLNPAIPAGFEAIVMKALAKEAGNRYQTADELRADLLRFIQGQPVAAEIEPTRVAAAVGGVAATQVIDAQPTRVATTAVGAAGGAGGTWVQSSTQYGPRGGPPGTSEEGRRALLAVALVLLLIALGVAGYFVGKNQGWWGTKTATIPTDIVKKPQQTAQTELATRGFKHVKPLPQASSTVGKGLVIGTKPPVGQSVAVNKTITLLVSSGPLPVALPNVINQPQDQALATLSNAGFKPTVTKQPSLTIQNGNVISTNPVAGTPWPPGSNVGVVISTGPQQVQIPFLAGETPSQAGQQLGKLGLTVGQQLQEASSTYPSGQVTRTSPAAGQMVAPNSSVSIYVSTGPAQVQVPDLHGLTQAGAQSQLQQAGLVANFTQVPVKHQSDDGLVVGQTPGAGTQVANGSTVNVQIGMFSNSSSTSSTSCPPASLPASTSTTLPPGC